MRTPLAIAALAYACFACEQIEPLRLVYLCEAQDAPWECSCADMAPEAERRDARCPECAGSDRDPACDDAAPDAAMPNGGSGGQLDAGEVDAGACGSCPAARPFCDHEVDPPACVECTRAADCGPSERPFCELESGTCVECLGRGDCAEPRAVCDTAVHTCVRCLDHEDCGGDTPRCDAEDRICVQCLEHADCNADQACNGAGQCVECTEQAHCQTPTASRCASEACVGCLQNEDCGHIDGRGICDQGTCVECTGTQYAACGSAGDGTPHVCDSTLRVCTAQRQREALTCQPCVSDAHCATGRLCMPMTFGAEATAVGNFCLWQTDATGTSGPNGDCLNVQPYVSSETNWTSLDGASPTSVCKPARTTCQAHNDFLGTSCSGSDTTGHAECGAEDHDDAFCAPFSLQHRCTVPCVSYDDCRDLGSGMECQQRSLGGQDLFVCVFE